MYADVIHSPTTFPIRRGTVVQEFCAFILYTCFVIFFFLNVLMSSVL